MLTPVDTLSAISAASEKKSSLTVPEMLKRGFLAGLFIAFAALASTIASMNLTSTPETYGLGKLIQGLVFSGGLTFVILSSAELFTGNSLMTVGLFSGKIKAKILFRNWLFVYLGNFLGAITLALLVSASGLFSSGSGALGASLASIATAKSSLSFLSALILGFLCNILVCLAVYLAFSTKSLQAKLICCIFPVTFFVMCGFEHSIANMFYIPAGIFAGSPADFLGFLGNLLPVTLGNVLGGVFLSYLFYSSYAKIKA